jgi:lambda family phage portal protein
MALVDQYGRPLQTKHEARSTPHKRSARLHAQYDAAQDTAENRKHWQWADNYSASAANSILVRQKLRSRSRYECLEANSFAKGMALTLANDTISTGPNLQVTGDRTLGAWIEREWRAWTRAVNLPAKLRTARLSKVVDGEVFLLKTTNRRLRTPVQLDIRLVEADQISTPGFFDGMPNQCDGIEFDKWRQPILYHMLKGHPGDAWNVGAWEKEDIDAEDMIHLFRSDRPGQVRGIPEFTPALPLFAFLRRWTLATIAASETAANLAAVLETEATGFDDDDFDGADPFDTLEIERNMMTQLPRGTKMNQFKPEQPTTTYEVFRNAILNEIARCVHMPRNKALADSSAYNYSSGRLDHQTYYEAIGVERSEWDRALDRVFEWWLDEALMLSSYVPWESVGGLAGDTLERQIEHEWRWNPPKHVDPGKEIGAAIDAIEAGLMTEEQWLHENNIDPEKHWEQVERQAARRRRLAALGGPTGIAPIEPSGASPGSPQAAGPAASSRSSTQEPGLAPTGSQEPASAPTSEFRDMSRRQMQNATKAIDDALDRLTSGEWSEARTRVFLSSVGMSDRTIDNLLSELLEEVIEGDDD